MALLFKFRNITSKNFLKYSSGFLQRYIDIASKSISNQMGDVNTGPISLQLTEKLKDSLSPIHLEVINESNQHNVPKGSETHFKVVVVSSKFDGIPLIMRHRLVNNILSEELNSGVHALSIVAKTPEQWDNSSHIIEKSPACKGGFGM